MNAWSLIGTEHQVRVKGGRTVYEAVDNTRNDRVRLQRMEVGATPADGIRVISRYVDADTELEVVEE